MRGTSIVRVRRAVPFVRALPTSNVPSPRAGPGDPGQAGGLDADSARGLNLGTESMIAVAALYHQDPAGWWADSPAIAGWSATAATLDELRSLMEGVRFALESDDVIVTHMCWRQDLRRPVSTSTSSTIR
jgi:hypothetical protein